MENREDLEAYWQKKADELGEPIIHKSIAQAYQWEAPDKFGILYLTGSFLIFEYSGAPRRSLLEALFNRHRDQELDQTIRISRGEIREAKLVNLSLARRWVRKKVPPKLVLEAIRSGKTSLFWNLISGSCLVVCLEDHYYAFNAPNNREWLIRLKK